jgi:dGTPase
MPGDGSGGRHRLLTYDLEDAFKAGLLTPLDLLSPSVELAADVARRVERELNVSTSAADVTRTLRRLFSEFAQPTEDLPTSRADAADWYSDELAHSYRVSRTAAENGFVRTALTSALVNRFIQAVDAKLDHRRLPLSQVVMREEERTEVSVLKHLTYVLLIRSNRMRLVAHRAGQMIREIFGALTASDGDTLLPPDVAERYRQAPAHQKKRDVCDYIAGMTDRYAVEFYARLTSETFYSMFKPH